MSVFLASTGLDWDQLQFLLTQGLSAAEQRQGLPTPSSSTPPALEPMKIAVDSSDINNPFYIIDNSPNRGSTG